VPRVSDPSESFVHRLTGAMRVTTLMKGAEKVQDEIRLERDVVWEERAAGIISDSAAQERYCGLNRRCISAGDDLWRHVKKKHRIDDPGAVQLISPGDGSGIAECLPDGQGKGILRRRPNHWRSGVEDY
jgi:hypothetical protein